MKWRGEEGGNTKMSFLACTRANATSESFAAGSRSEIQAEVRSCIGHFGARVGRELPRVCRLAFVALTHGMGYGALHFYLAATHRMTIHLLLVNQSCRKDIGLGVDALT
jgi:hypothetical protein